MNFTRSSVSLSVVVCIALVGQLSGCNSSNNHIGTGTTAPEKKPTAQPAKPKPVVQQSQAPQPVVVQQVQTQPVAVIAPVISVVPVQPVLPVVVVPVQPVPVLPVPVQPLATQPVVVQPVVVQPEVTQPQVEVSEGSMLIPITPFSNMASGYQATNEGFRAILKDSSGQVIASGPMSIDAAVKGFTDDASQGSAYGRLVLNVDLKYVAGSVQSGAAAASGKGSLSICMAQDTAARYDEAGCKSLGGNLHPERPFQWLDKGVSYKATGNQIKITGFDGQTGEGGTRSQIALAAFHPAYGFAAPGKAFKDYQSPIVLDLNNNGKFDLIDVWDDSVAVKFDIMDNGKALRTGWIAAGDGFLALDINGDGKVSSGAELFGEYSMGKVKNADRGNTFRLILKSSTP